MPVFNYTARDEVGLFKKGIVEAATLKEAASLIRERSLFITDLKEQRRQTISRFFLMKRVSFKDIVNFTRQLSTMIGAGLQLQESLILLRSQSKNQAFAEILDKIARDIQSGQNLATTLSQFPKQFSGSYIALIKAGEASGTLDKVLLRLAENLEKDQEFQAKVKGAMVYPIIIVITMIIVFFVLMTVVVPQLLVIYEDFETKLPWPTLVLQVISNFSVRFWWVLLLGGFLFVYGFNKWKSSYIGKHVYDGVLLRLPVFGTLLKEILLVEFTRTLGLLVGAGVHILDALQILIGVLNNIHFRESVEAIAQKVEKGYSMGALFAQVEIFPPIVAQMIKVGEETGKMDESLMKLSTYFERESEHKVKALTTAIEPLIMVVLGVVVGFIVYAVIMPLYSLTSTL
jgi:type IV pilus assembly protein PilC